MPADRIFLEGMHFYGYHGGNVEERQLGQPFQVHLEAELDLTAPGKSDDLADTISYTHLYRAVKQVMEGPPRNLLEAAAEDIASAILSSFPVSGVRVRVKKTRSPIKEAHLESAGVEIYRTRA